jgi:hypothetical protein
LRIKATLLILFGLLAACQAQLKISLKFESAAPREVFVASELPKAPPSETVKSGGAALDYNVLAAFGGNDRIYIWDRSTNNIASKPIKDISNSAWAPTAADFSLIGTVTVHVEHKGLPVQVAKVSLGGKGKTEEKLLDPGSKGDVAFFGYPTGDLHVKVAYNTSDKKEGSQELTFTEAAKRDKPEPVLTVAISDDVATVADTPSSPAAAQGSTPAKDKTQKPGEDVQEGSPVGKLVVMFLALLVIAGGAYWVYYIVKNKPKQFESTLQKLGVQIPQQQDPNLSAPTPVTPLAPAPPPPKIMLDDAEPIPLGVAVAAPTPLVSTGEPTLVSDSGQRTSLSEGETIVGREEGLGLSLVGESTVSRRHASLVRTGKAAVLVDLGSTNGTFVNGTRLQGETILKPGDQVLFGSVRFRYEG